MLWVLGISLFLLATSSLAQWQQIFRVDSDKSKHAITPAILELAEQLLPEGNISGLSIGVVHSGNIVELKGWGVKSEDGDQTSPDVSFSLSLRWKWCRQAVS
jgi:CubicO group peptidase (beta-lactamase class C family)